MTKPFSQACENNKQPIKNILMEVLAKHSKVLEIGSGTGQHALYFAEQLPHLVWQPSDVAENLWGIEQWLSSAQRQRLGNLKPAIELDIEKHADGLLVEYKQGAPKTDSAQAMRDIDASFSANTLHIMSWPTAQKCIAFCANILPVGGRACFYGPFNYSGKYTATSNARFDQWLQQRNPLSGIRDFEDVVAHAQQHQLALLNDYGMPANNRLLVFEKL